MKKFIKQAIQCIIAIVLAVCISNVFLGLYSRDTGWIDRDKASTTGIYLPNTSFLHGKEGRGYHVVDSRGYVNDTDKLADNYIIAVGASHNQGEEVPRGKRYTDLLNSWSGHTEDAYVYNVSQNAYFLPKVIKGFTALTTEFPNSSKIIIEVNATTFDIEDLQDALEQREYDETQTGQNILPTLSTVAKIKILAKRYLPLMNDVNAQIKAIKNPKSNDDNEIDLIEYEKALDDGLALIRSIYSNEIIIMYHPKLEINDDGMSIIKEQTTDTFKKVCEKNNITFINMEDTFIKEYKNDYSVPYGFSNTSIGAGHLNEKGHYLVAKELMPYITEE